MAINPAAALPRAPAAAAVAAAGALLPRRDRGALPARLALPGQRAGAALACQGALPCLPGPGVAETRATQRGRSLGLRTVGVSAAGTRAAPTAACAAASYWSCMCCRRNSWPNFLAPLPPLPCEVNELRNKDGTGFMQRGEAGLQLKEGGACMGGSQHARQHGRRSYLCPVSSSS